MGESRSRRFTGEDLLQPELGHRSLGPMEAMVAWNESNTLDVSKREERAQEH